ncbi:transposase [Spongiibacter taiwanensis]|uniref:transposase n=1 Tax=Spongiibacter taiwanensis TaxID=1748242 RepID=UPI002034BAAC|nr:transposase [Spongiibacter taiwanensis]USA43184.1 transposase [Spongiibacter taiwanensis]
MARMARVVVPGYPHHVTQRGNRRQKTFFSDDDYRFYIELMSQFTRESGTEVWAYCLMPNHVHLVMVPSKEDGLRAALGEAHRRYTRHVNARQGWRGHLWQERFHSFVMDERHLLATVKYVERNPVVAGLSRHPADWQWSSAKAHLAGRDDGLVKVSPMLDRITNWTDYLSAGHRDEAAIIQQHTRTGRPLGSTNFIKNLEALTGKALMPGCPGRKPNRKKAR